MRSKSSSMHSPVWLDVSNVSASCFAASAATLSALTARRSGRSPIRSAAEARRGERSEVLSCVYADRGSRRRARARR
eukprot:4041946-Prymnesium_polylepis.2